MFIFKTILFLSPDSILSCLSTWPIVQNLYLFLKLGNVSSKTCQDLPFCHSTDSHISRYLKTTAKMTLSSFKHIYFISQSYFIVHSKVLHISAFLSNWQTWQGEYRLVTLNNQESDYLFLAQSEVLILVLLFPHFKCLSKTSQFPFKHKKFEDAS